MFLASSQPPLASTQRYLSDIGTADADLSALRAGGGQNQAASAALDTLARDLPVYTGYVAEARSDYALGYPLTGGSFLQVASEEAHLDLLPAAKTVFDQRERRARGGEQAGDRAAAGHRRPGARDHHRRRLVPGAAVADQAHQPDAQRRARPRVAGCS